jgi:hypothetical protein
MAIFFPWLAQEQRWKGARAVAARRPPCHGCGRQEGEKKEGDEGVLLPSSPWARVRCGGGSWAAADCRLGQLGWRRGGVQGGLWRLDGEVVGDEEA